MWEEKGGPYPGVWLKPLTTRDARILAQVATPQGLSPLLAEDLQFPKDLTRKPFTAKGHVQPPSATPAAPGFTLPDYNFKLPAEH